MRIPLERLKTIAGNKFMSTRIERKVYIYSDQWGAYWRPNKQGYCYDKESAGVYTLSEAFNTTCHCGKEKHIIFKFID